MESGMGWDGMEDGRWKVGRVTELQGLSSLSRAHAWLQVTVL
jgi:hypothetical protein